MPAHWYTIVLIGIPGGGVIHHKYSTERCLDNSGSSREINYPPKLVSFPASYIEASRHRIALLIAYREADLGLLGLVCWETPSVLREIIHFIKAIWESWKKQLHFAEHGTCMRSFNVSVLWTSSLLAQFGHCIFPKALIDLALHKMNKSMTHKNYSWIEGWGMSNISLFPDFCNRF